MNQTQAADSTRTSISEVPSSPSATRPSGGRTLSHNLTVAARSFGTAIDGNAWRQALGSQSFGSICRSERKTFHVTASSLFALRKCFRFDSRMSANTGSWRSMIRFDLKSSAMTTPLIR
jgi:hypothetical protein